VTVTPGNTPPVESVTVPFTVASCACAITGKDKSTAVRSQHRVVIGRLRQNVSEGGILP
jgi:hypothetical protein